MTANNLERKPFIDLYHEKSLDYWEQQLHRRYVMNAQIERLLPILPILFTAYFQETPESAFVPLLESIGIWLSAIDRECIADCQEFHQLKGLDAMENLLNAIAFSRGYSDFGEFYLSILTAGQDQGGFNS